MAYWKFTDVYGSTYPALTNSILSILVFDVPSGTPINGTNFNASLDLQATGKAMGVLSSMLGMTTVPMTGTVTTTNNILNIDLASSNNAAILSALAACIPLIGGQLMQAASLAIKNTTPQSATVDDDPTTDQFNLNTTVKIGNGSGDVTTQIPMSNGLFTMSATFSNFGIGLSDLNFLVPQAQFSSMFPTTLPTNYYNPASTTLNLLSLELSLYVKTSPSLSISVNNVSTSIGIVNIPLYPNALYLNPLAIWISVSNPLSSQPTPTWGLNGSIALYPYGKQTSPPSVPPDFSYDLAMQMPTRSDPTFSVTGTLDNPQNLPVSQILCDLMNDGSFNTGISNQLTLEKFDFATVADTSTGTINEFSVEIAMDASGNGGSYIGLFSDSFGVKDFSIAVAYVK
ncbi:hypothetical protein [Undibacterium sp. TS12]|uniref:hypothetical protein n=1 Tax=Undibacterium sp. TS12 TaxID=2908202 RepID=UPI001F4CA041|nr:hypothetical protein [Undibacterium sp. TS12]MCH8620965.1 hypothetical protein [Undibacterium sp. TS12]